MHSAFIEPLEARIAPATLVNPKTLTFTDGDGDTAEVKFSLPLLTSASVANAVFKFNTGSVDGSNAAFQNLTEINLTSFGSLAKGLSLSVQVTGGSGDGKVNVDLIRAAVPNPDIFQITGGTDLGVVKVAGDLGAIWCGDQLADRAIKRLEVDSLATRPGLAETESIILGPAIRVLVHGDVEGRLKVIGAQYGKLKNLVIEGSLIGGADDNSGQVLVTGTLRNVRVDGDILGGAGLDSGQIAGSSFTGGKVVNVQVGGSIIGGSGESSGRIQSNGTIEQLTVGQNIQGGSGNYSGQVRAPAIGSLVIGGDLAGGSGANSGQVASSSSIGLVSVGADGTGSILGGSGQASGSILASTHIGSVTVADHVTGASGAGSGRIGAPTTAIFNTLSIEQIEIGGRLTGGAGNASGQLAAGLKIGSLLIGNDVAGGAGANSGLISAGEIGSLYVGNDGMGASLTGGTAANSGSILVGGGGLHKLVLNGDLTGGTGTASGAIILSGTLRSGAIYGDVVGGNSDAFTALAKTGYIEAERIFELAIQGSLIAGSDGGAGLKNSGAIRATNDLQTLTIGGDVLGNATNPAIISGAYNPNTTPSSKNNFAIGDLTVAGNVDHAEILAGYDNDTSTSFRGKATDPDAQIRSVTIGGNLSASTIAAGVAAGADGLFGTADDTKITGGAEDYPKLISRIASVVVAGTAAGSGSGSENYGIVAQHVQSVVIGGAPLGLTTGPSNDLAPGVNIGLTSNFKAMEVA